MRFSFNYFPNNITNNSFPESILSALLSKRSLTLTQKNILVLGYGSIGNGIAKLCRSHGSHVTITDNDPVKRIFAISQGFNVVDVVRMNETLYKQDIIISCTYNVHGSYLDVEQFLLMKDEAIVINAGSGNGEISSKMLALGTFEKNRAKIQILEKNDDLNCIFTKMNMKKKITILCSGHPINLRYGNGTAKEIIDFVFSMMLLASVNTNPSKLDSKIHPLDVGIEEKVASLWEETQHLPYRLQPQLIKTIKLKAKNRPWGKLFRFVSEKNNLERFSLARAVFKPNSNTDGHYHAISEEAYLAEHGNADIVTWDPQKPKDKIKFSVKPGDYIAIPKGRAHRVCVTSKRDFTCLIIASPPFNFWDQFFPITKIKARKPTPFRVGMNRPKTSSIRKIL